MVKVEMK